MFRHQTIHLFHILSLQEKCPSTPVVEIDCSRNPLLKFIGPRVPRLPAVNRVPTVFRETKT